MVRVKTPADAARLTMQKLSAKAVKRGLDTQFVGQEVVYHDSVGSTNDLAKDLAKQGAPAGTLVVADEQTAGKGRQGRRWISPPGASLLISLILRPSLTASDAPRLIMASSLAVASAIEEVADLTVRFKWPNDILLRGKKAGGVLVETGISGQAIDYAVVGIGVNANLDAGQIPEIADFATSISMEGGTSVSRLDLLQALLRFMEREYLLLMQGESPWRRWRQRLSQLGENLEVTTPWGRESGLAESVDADGALILRREDGTTARITVGDVQ